MGKSRAVALVLWILICTLGIAGCSSSKPVITVTLSPTAATINQGESQAITATLANDTTNQGVTWSVTGAGILGNPTTSSVTYVAPSTLTSNSTGTVTATSVANTAVTAAVTITVNAVLEITTTSLPPATQGLPYLGVITATGATGTFTWSLTSGTLPAGLTLSSSTTAAITISGTSTTLGTSRFTMQVVDSSGANFSQSLNLTVNAPPPLSVANKSLLSGTVGVPYSQNLQAASGVSPFTWLLKAGSLPAGLSLSSNGAISGTPTTLGTSGFTVQVTDSTKPTAQIASAELDITISLSTANNAKLNGNYAFLVSGFSPNGHFVAAGSFLADGNGNITNGVMDSNDPLTLLVSRSFTGTYLIDATDLGTMTLSIPGVGSRVFALSVMANGNAKIIEFDDLTGNGTRNSGVLLKQDTSAFSTAQINGSYAFGFLGTGAQGGRYGLAGQFQANAGLFTSGALDSDDAGVTAANVAFAGTYSVPTANPPTGRGTATISVAGQRTTNYSFYVVSATRLLVMETDNIPGVGSPLVSGSILQQSGSLALNGNSVFETTALDTSGSPSTAVSLVGLFTTNGSTTLTVSADENTAGSLTPISSIGTYAVSNGRATINGSGIATSDPVLYLVSPNEAFLVGTDANVTFGFMTAQSGTFTTASLTVAYAGGSIAPVSSAGTNEVVALVPDGAGGFTATTDSSTGSGLGQNQASSGGYSVIANGRGVFTVNSINTSIFYMISATAPGAEFFSLSTDANATVDMFAQ